MTGQEYLKAQRNGKTTFFSPANESSLPAPSTIKSEEREFVVDSGASRHMLSRKDLNSAELETVKVSKSPTTVVTANGEVQTTEEATVYVKELDLFVTVKLLDDTPAVLSLGKLCEDHGYSYEWTSGHKPQLTQSGRRIKCSTANCVPIVVPGLSTSSSSSATPAENQTGPHHLEHRRKMVKQEMICGPFQGITFTVVTLNRESNCTCQEKNHSQFHCDTLT